MRLFVAIKTSDEVRNYLRKLQKSFEGIGNFNFTKEFHLTLKFLGEVEENNVEKLNGLLKEVKHKRFELCIDKLGVFPGVKNARVLWVGVRGDVKPLRDKAENSLKEDFGSDERFKAHITIARINGIGDEERFKEMVLKTKIEEIRFMVDDFRLVKSELKRSGAVYTDICVYRLE